MVVALGCPLLLATCGGGEDPAGAIREFLSEAARLSEEHNAEALMALAAEDFRLEPHGMNRHEVRKALLFAFRHYLSFRVLYPKPRIQFEDGERRARVTFPFIIVRKEISLPGLKELLDDPRRWAQEVGDRADLYWMELHLIRSGKDAWSAETATIRPFSGLEGDH